MATSATAIQLIRISEPIINIETGALTDSGVRWFKNILSLLNQTTDTVNNDLVAKADYTAANTILKADVAGAPLALQVAASSVVGRTASSAVGSLSAANLKVILNYNTSEIPESGNLYYTDGRARDAVGNILADTAEINFTYDGLTPEITASLINNSIAATRLKATATDILFGRRTAGAGAGEEIVCTAAGRALIDDASAAAQRGTLGLGTAATQNTGTSGATLPFLSGSNVWTGSQTLSAGVAVPIVIQWDDDGASPGPFLATYRNTASPAVNDSIGGLLVRGRDSATNVQDYAALDVTLLDPTSGSEDCNWNIWTNVAGVLGIRATVGQGFVVGAPTGGDKGANTLNATTLYEDGTALAARYQAASVFPKVSAYLSANQTITNGTATKITFDTETFDTNSNFDSATNYRFTPTVAGKYRISAVCEWTTTVASYTPQLMIYKNGTIWLRVSHSATYLAAIFSQTITDLIDMNGSTDYIEIFVQQDSGGSRALSGGTTLTRFSAEMAP